MEILEDYHQKAFDPNSNYFNLFHVNFFQIQDDCSLENSTMPFYEYFSKLIFQTIECDGLSKQMEQMDPC